MTAHEEVIELLARSVWVLHRVEAAVPADLAGGPRRRFVKTTGAWLLGSCGAPGRWGTCAMFGEETRIATRRLASARRYIDQARRELEVTSNNFGYPPHLRKTVTVDVIALQGDLADIDQAIQETAA